MLPSWHVHIRRCFGQVKPSQLPFEPSRMVWLDAGLAVSYSIWHLPVRSLDLIQLPIIPIWVENSSQFHHLGLFIDRIDDPIFSLRHPKAGETPIGEMRELLRIRRTGRTAETENLEEDLAETFGIAVTKLFDCREDGL